MKQWQYCTLQWQASPDIGLAVGTSWTYGASFWCPDQRPRWLRTNILQNPGFSFGDLPTPVKPPCLQFPTTLLTACQSHDSVSARNIHALLLPLNRTAASLSPLSVCHVYATSRNLWRTDTVSCNEMWTELPVSENGANSKKYEKKLFDQQGSPTLVTERLQMTNRQ